MLPDIPTVPPGGCFELLGAWKAILLAYPLLTYLEKDFATFFRKEMEMPFVSKLVWDPQVLSLFV